ncbi:XrtA/PEP-CTERM system histidine kinase PrsK [Marichromatium bheemlicum]|uniref:histidine kinase n=1 Tax=Marichromatium bheemlicum TaxID=365339 RepID=A0ABX1I980_9GAMM|nr:XrtA/PEP-CTERM system histidine kinase PrsK [Marichromatium bheemlicum]NKN33356.1 PEP-CTERM system histidine kinase PrsK [Marichromatium bheemlicum]
MNVASFSYATALIAYLVLTLLLITAWRGRLLGLFALLASLASACWAGIVLAMQHQLLPPGQWAAVAELVRNAAWFVFLSRVLLAERERRSGGRWAQASWWIVGGGALLTLALPLLSRPLGLGPVEVTNAVLLGWVLWAIFGLVLLEQIIRNRRPEQRWGIKHLCLGLGAVFAFDLFFFSDALLLHRIDPALWQARGLVHALVVPLIAVSAARNPSWSLEVHVSRHAVFHSATLTGAGLYLLAMAAAGYYIRYFGGAWGAVLQITFLFAALLFLLAVVFSGQLRARLRVLLSRHFFNFKYDYREQWLSFTTALSRPGVALPEAVVSALGGLVDSPGGMLWVEGEHGGLEFCVQYNWITPQPQILAAEAPMVEFLRRRAWVIDLDEYHADPERYQGVELPDWLCAPSTAWLVIPLLHREMLCGFVVLARGATSTRLNWEDRSLLRTAGRQAAAHVAQHLADQALMRARQFEAFNQLSAYVAHDLKNLLAQQSLIVSNAERHRDNPAFLDDVIHTVRSSVERMTRLMEQLREGVRGEAPQRLDLVLLLSEVVHARSSRAPVPVLETPASPLCVRADRERLLNVFSHLVQNAQEATPPEGRVRLGLDVEEGFAIVEIEDDGVGMSAEFIRDRLFKPFDSTKGLTGMGIGAFESREFVRLLGGDLLVHSRPGKGSMFRVCLPLDDDVQQETAVAGVGHHEVTS